MTERNERTPAGDGAEGPGGGASAPEETGTRKAGEETGERQTGAARGEEDAPDAWEASEQLRSLARHLFARGGSGNVLRDPDVRGDVVGGDKYDLHLYGHAAARTAAGRASGPLPAEEIAAVERVFVAGRRYDEAYDRLRAQRVLVLRGQRGTGRRTAGVRLLRQVVGDGRVIALDPGTDLAEPAELDGQLEPGCGHLLADPVTSGESPLRAVRLHALRERLAGSGGFLVITADPETVLEGVDPARWEAPEADRIIRAHLRVLLGEDAGGTGEDLLHRPETKAFLGRCPTPAEAAGFARLLAEHARGRVAAGELEEYGRAAAEQRVDAWFADPGLKLREKAFLISLAVFDAAPYPLVAEFADLLFRELRRLETPGRDVALPVFATPLEARLRTARAVEYDGALETPWGTLPQRLVAFRDSGLWEVLLGRVWMTHPTVREPALAWLARLGTDPRAMVRIRAAVCAGTLACHDFAFAADRLIAPWAASPRPRERQLAAWALAAAHQAGRETPVRRLLRSWSRGGDEGRRWTAVRAYALLGDAMVPTALADLAAVAATAAGTDAAAGSRLRQAVVQTLETLIGGPAGPEVLARLDRWREPDRWLRHLAADAFLRAAAHHHTAPDGTRAPLPSPVRWAREGGAAWERYVELWRQVLGDPALRRDGLERIGAWVRAAGHDAELEDALAGLLPGMAATGNETDRLDHLLRKVQGRHLRETGEPLPVAGRLSGALGGSRAR